MTHFLIGGWYAKKSMPNNPYEVVGFLRNGTPILQGVSNEKSMITANSGFCGHEWQDYTKPKGLQRPSHVYIYKHIGEYVLRCGQQYDYNRDYVHALVEIDFNEHDGVSVKVLKDQVKGV